jgi:hypothetical protein
MGTFEFIDIIYNLISAKVIKKIKQRENENNPYLNYIDSFYRWHTYTDE